MEELTALDKLERGTVEVISGPFKGKIGFYDGDTTDGAIVYFDLYYEIIPHEFLRNTLQIYTRSYH